LHLLPFDILQREDGHFVGDEHVVSLAVSGTVLQLLRKAPVQRLGSDRVLAVGLAGPPAGSNLGPVGAPASETRGVFDVTGADLGALPATAEEIHFVAERAGPTTAILEGTAATETNFKAQRLGAFGVLHLALHGVADVKFPDRSALVFRPDPDGAEDGLLQVREIRSLRLGAQLVTLSACDTGLGRIEGQEGMASIVRAFLFAGARNVAAALWDVGDVSTTALMKRFYTRLAEGVEVAEALQMAKIDMRRNLGRTAKAYYWGGFVMVGDGRSIVRLGPAAAVAAAETRISRP
jgi:CHAT domain-containing protein